MRKRNIIYGLIGLELLAIPVGAVMFSEYSQASKNNVIAAEIASPPGVKRYFVTSDSPFQITGQNLTGKVNILAIEQGEIGDVAFGGNAQLPGPAESCGQAAGPEEQIFYEGERKVLKAEGEPASEAVLFLVFYDKDLDPEFRFIPSQTSKDLPSADGCS